MLSYKFMFRHKKKYIMTEVIFLCEKSHIFSVKKQIIRRIV